MKKVVVALFVAVLALGLAACGQKKDYEIGLVTDVGTINDKSFNQGAWEGVEQYAEEHKISYKYYQPDTKSTEDYVKSIEVAIKNGAKIVVTPGFLFENAIWLVQDKYPAVKFIILDGAPHNVTDFGAIAPGDETTIDGDTTGKNANFEIGANVYSIFYSEEQSGFLAGYAAVKEGFTKLGFMGGMSVPAVVRFGYGFVQGANYAASQMTGVTVTIKYEYLNSFAPDAAHQTKAASWYTSGTEVIFVAAGGAGNSVMKAAEGIAGKYVIGVDVDQKAESDRVITSAMKELKSSVYNALDEIYNNRQYNSNNQVITTNGKSVTLDASVGGIGLPQDFSRFSKFTKAMYDVIFAEVAAGSITIVNDHKLPVTSLVVPKVTLDVTE
ncbi:BMP family ABC transporter substrate-binding protein [Acholeplasma vituli]|uniref:BMP family ABC transporter substrate-binding protein n=1 Tax=Paracholeplasma vituli TaxID=69473 RepID=A0ABT2PV99_9MOLU|nr:BMP family ABC transporter substrate-binding protein [Paracholeplasma vituli]MCU0104643.1 BMP family ABC transporter substrate-binding protein [Paracholeplasma vituli]